jgi:hypothetical protein
MMRRSSATPDEPKCDIQHELKKSDAEIRHDALDMMA